MSGANCEFARSKISPIGLTADGLWDLQCWGYDWGGYSRQPTISMVSAAQSWAALASNVG